MLCEFESKAGRSAQQARRGAPKIFGGDIENNNIQGNIDFGMSRIEESEKTNENDGKKDKLNLGGEDVYRSTHGDHPSYYQPKHIREIVYPKYYKPLFSTDHINPTDPSTWVINLTAEEKNTFEEILKAIKAYNKSVVVRAAGGWVRDKLLNCQSDDIDLAVDTMTGETFGEMLQGYWQNIKHETITLGKIKENPDKSKHLASVTFKLGSIAFDVANLRTEEYSQHTRVPTVKVGTPEQDSFRRDLTFNALFYNLNLGCVEDFTKLVSFHLFLLFYLYIYIYVYVYIKFCTFFTIKLQKT
ncbi:hypothetical protein RFI_10252 [Reticulomyxa filosa]|uniref:Poly A polymerase head domain-containing protein n=1 Tax=Reticulomyxa filosa TaxID=46433 RepID=X6NLW7_RETFI|nr:hypothetical protein RFI_10252 [Reticulomyxa filosa]|eukprot:ETO26883.1 hypothetical protein RFI_10252 [Reticulomyxa filosa]